MEDKQISGFDTILERIYSKKMPSPYGINSEILVTYGKKQIIREYVLIKVIDEKLQFETNETIKNYKKPPGFLVNIKL